MDWNIERSTLPFIKTRSWNNRFRSSGKSHLRMCNSELSWKVILLLIKRYVFLSDKSGAFRPPNFSSSQPNSEYLGPYQTCNFVGICSHYIPEGYERGWLSVHEMIYMGLKVCRSKFKPWSKKRVNPLNFRLGLGRIYSILYPRRVWRHETFLMVEQFKKLWLSGWFDFVIVPELSTDHRRPTVIGAHVFTCARPESEIILRFLWDKQLFPPPPHWNLSSPMMARTSNESDSCTGRVPRTGIRPKLVRENMLKRAIFVKRNITEAGCQPLGHVITYPRGYAMW